MNMYVSMINKLQLFKRIQKYFLLYKLPGSECGLDTVGIYQFDTIAERTYFVTVVTLLLF